MRLKKEKKTHQKDHICEQCHKPKYECKCDFFDEQADYQQVEY